MNTRLFAAFMGVLLLVAMIPVTEQGPFSYGICQTGCNVVYGACYMQLPEPRSALLQQPPTHLSSYWAAIRLRASVWQHALSFVECHRSEVNHT